MYIRIWIKENKYSFYKKGAYRWVQESCIIVFHLCVAKGVTHFKDIDASGKSRINYFRFYDTHKDTMNKPFYLGYLCHLISDVVWLELYLKIVGFASPQQLKEKILVAYRDFERLNGRIIKQYSLELHQHVLPTVNIDEATLKGRWNNDL